MNATAARRMLMISAWAASAAYAQQQPGTSGSQSSPGVLEDIIVTAEKRSESLEKVPLSIVAFNAQTLAETGVEDFSSLAARIPGVTLNSAGPGQSSYSIRGIASVGGNSPTTGIYIDDTPILPSGGDGATASIDPGLVRSGARRGAARTSRHSVRREFDGRHGPAHHQPAEPHPDRGRGQRRRARTRNTAAAMRGSMPCTTCR